MQNEKKPDDSVDKFLSSVFERAKSTIGKSLETLSQEARHTLKAGEKVATDAWVGIQDTVGKDRIIGAIAGAKIGGAFGVVGGVHGVAIGGVIGTVAGFAGARKFFEWYNQEGGNDNKPK